MAIAQVMAQPAHTSLWCVMHDCAFTHAYSIVMVEYIINLFLIYHSLKFRQSIFICPKTALSTTGHKNPQLATGHKINDWP